jgi:hypothetical protein
MREIVVQIGETLFPLKLRPFLTFRSVTAFVLLLSVSSLILRLAARLSPEVIARMQQQEALVRSPLFLTLYNLLLLFGFWGVFATRRNPQYYWLRSLGFGMLLAAVIAQFGIILVPWRG